MKFLQLSVYAALGLTLLGGCGSSSTTAPSSTPQSTGPRSEKSPDDEMNELMVKAMTLSPAEKKEQGPAMLARMMELRGKVSDETRKRLDGLMFTSIDQSAGASRTAEASIRSDSASIRIPTASRDRSEVANEVPPTAGNRPPTALDTPPAISPEVLPQPREK